MKITEVEWIKKNNHKLDADDINALNNFDFFNQLKDGELHLPLPQMMELMSLATYIYQKHNKLEESK